MYRMRCSRMYGVFFLFFLIFCDFISLEAASHIYRRRNSHFRNNYSSRINRPWDGRFSRWPSYYAYYGSPFYGSTYYYSYPLNSTYYYSYPSYYSHYTYPSYPYNGYYYVNSYPVPASQYYNSPTFNRRQASIRRDFVPANSSTYLRGSTGVFLGP